MSATTLPFGDVLPIVGPFTTSFKQPGECVVPYLRCESSTQSCFLTRDVSCGDDSLAHWGTKCYPPATGSFGSYTVNGQAMSGPVYSPGVGCPVGYARMTVAGDIFDSDIINCCPVGYTINQDGAFCSSQLKFENSRAAVLSCMGRLTRVVSLTQSEKLNTIVYDTGGGNTIEIGGNMAVYGEPVRFIRASSLSTATNENNGNSNDNHVSLSGGAIAGIVIGAIVFGILVAAAVWILLRRRKLKDTQTEGRFETSIPGNLMKQEMPADAVPTHQSMQAHREELDSLPVGVGSMTQPVELANAPPR